MDEGLALAPGPATLNSGTGRAPGAGLTSQVDPGVLPKPTFVSNSARLRKEGGRVGKSCADFTPLPGAFQVDGAFWACSTAGTLTSTEKSLGP